MWRRLTTKARTVAQRLASPKPHVQLAATKPRSNRQQSPTTQNKIKKSRPTTDQAAPQKGHRGVATTGTKAGGGATTTSSSRITRGNRLANGKTGTFGMGKRETLQEEGITIGEATEGEAGEVEEEEVGTRTAGVVVLTAAARETRTSGGRRADWRGRCSDIGLGEVHPRRPCVFLPVFI